MQRARCRPRFHGGTKCPENKSLCQGSRADCQRQQLHGVNLQFRIDGMFSFSHGHRYLSGNSQNADCQQSFTPSFILQMLILISQNLAPRLVETIKTAGLVLIGDISHATPDSADTRLFIGRDADKGIDGTVQSNGVLHFNESVDL